MPIDVTKPKNKGKVQDKIKTKPKSKPQEKAKPVVKSKSTPKRSEIATVVPVERLKKSALLQKSSRDKLVEKLNINLANSEVSPTVIVEGNISTKTEELVNTIIDHADIFYSNSVKNKMDKSIKSQGVRIL